MSHDDLKKTIARVDVNGRPCGTAFLVDRDHVATAAHVLTHHVVDLVFPEWHLSDRERVGTVAWRHPANGDVAILKLDRSCPAEIVPVQWGKLSPKSSWSWSTFGFPSGCPNGISLTNEKVTDPDWGIYDGRLRVFQLDTKLARESLRGLSGAPCVVADAIVGVIAIQLRRPAEGAPLDAEKTPSLNTLIAMPINLLATSDLLGHRVGELVDGIGDEQRDPLSDPPVDGGGTGKLVNRYEAYWTIQQMIRVLSSDVGAVELKSASHRGFEFIVKSSAGDEFHHVNRQHAEGAWTLGDLGHLNVLDSFRACLKLHPRNRCIFVSTDRAIDLHELSERARLDQSPKEFVDQFLASKRLKNAWLQLLTKWSDNPDTLLDMIRRIHVRSIDESTLVEHQRLWLSAALVRGTVVQAENALFALVFNAVGSRVARENVTTALKDAGVELRARATPRLNPPDKQTPRWHSEEQRALGTKLLIAHEELDAAANEPARKEVQSRIVDLKRLLRQGRPPAEGDILAERFVLVRLIGSGGFAGVWLARDRAAAFAPVAVKLLHLRHAYDQVSRVDRFFRGARIMARLQHPNIVRVLVGAGEEKPASYFFVMEHLPGPNLLQALTSLPPLKERMSWLRGLALALEHAHKCGVVHRDVKPQNVVLDHAGVAKLTDFDLTWATDTSGGTEQAPMGSLIYGAPEVLEGIGEVTPSCDVYSFAITTIAVLAGREPPGTIIRGAGDYVRRTRPCELSDKAIALLERSTSWNPAERARSPLALYEELAREMGCSEGPDEPSAALERAVVAVVKPPMAVPAAPLGDGVWTCPRGIDYVRVPVTGEPGAETAFWMSRMPIKQDQFDAFVRETCAEEPPFSRGHPWLPAVGVSWHQAAAFAVWANAALPEIREWEHACHAGRTNGHATGGIFEGLDASAWHEANANSRKHPCGEKVPNRWGLYDMLGNVWEWCNAPADEPNASICGGSYQSSAEQLHRALVSRRNKENAQRDLGFRIISTANKPTSTHPSGYQPEQPLPPRPQN